jgi:hypothetical protein
MAGAVVQHEAALGRGEVAVGDVDRDALLALGAQISVDLPSSTEPAVATRSIRDT